MSNHTTTQLTFYMRQYLVQIIHREFVEYFSKALKVQLGELEDEVISCLYWNKDLFYLPRHHQPDILKTVQVEQ